LQEFSELAVFDPVSKTAAKNRDGVLTHTTWTEFEVSKMCHVMDKQIILSCIQHRQSFNGDVRMLFKTQSAFPEVLLSNNRKGGLRKHAMTSIPATIQHVIAKATFQMKVCWRSTWEAASIWTDTAGHCQQAEPRTVLPLMLVVYLNNSLLHDLDL